MAGSAYLGMWTVMDGEAASSGSVSSEPTEGALRFQFGREYVLVMSFGRLERSGMRTHCCSKRTTRPSSSSSWGYGADADWEREGTMAQDMVYGQGREARLYMGRSRKGLSPIHDGRLLAVMGPSAEHSSHRIPFVIPFIVLSCSISLAVHPYSSPVS
jgi:hypothetical protein